MCIFCAPAIPMTYLLEILSRRADNLNVGQFVLDANHDILPLAE